MSGSTLLTRYRPASWDEVLGHDEILRALRRALAAETRPHALLFTGPSGVGKTTVARIVGTELAAEISEVDAATNSGVDAMRGLMEIASYQPMGKVERRMLIIDECHALSKSAWQAALKIVEEPPRHLFLAFCTTELEKVPETIQTRCFHVPLKPVKPDQIADLLMLVTEMEGWQVKDEVLGAVINAATGQPRKALTLLQAVYGAASKDEVRRIITLIEDDDGYKQLARALLDGAAWSRVKDILPKLDLEDADQGIVGLGRYLSAVLTNPETTETTARRAWILLDALVYPANTWDRRAAFLAAIGRMVWGE